MASPTIRQLDDDTKKRLRLRGAPNDRSMEDEARVILRGAAAQGPERVGAVRPSFSTPTGSRLKPESKSVAGIQALF